MVVETTSAALTRVTVRFAYRVLRGPELLCEGDTLLACVGHDMAPKRLPEPVARMLASAEAEPAAWATALRTAAGAG